MSEEGAQPYEITITSKDAQGQTHTAHGEVQCSDPAEEVARGILETLQAQRGKDHVRIVDADS
jgi:hypothetical protein